VNAIVRAVTPLTHDESLSRLRFPGVIAKPYEAAELGKIVHDVMSRVTSDIIHYQNPGRGLIWAGRLSPEKKHANARGRGRLQRL